MDLDKGAYEPFVSVGHGVGSVSQPALGGHGTSGRAQRGRAAGWFVNAPLSQGHGWSTPRARPGTACL